MARDGDKDEAEITPAMMDAGVAALRGHYGEPGEAVEHLRRAVTDVFEAMRIAEPPGGGRQGP